MFNLKKLLPTMLAALSLSTAGAAHATGYYVESNIHYHGQARMKIANDRARIDLKELQIFINPDSSVRVYNVLTSKWCMLSDNFFGENKHDKQWSNVKQGASATMCGVHATQYYAAVYDRNSKGFHHEYDVDFWTTKDLHLNQRCTDAYCDMLELPGGYGMPLMLRRSYPDGRRVEFLHTVVCNPYTLTAADLKEPTGFQFCKDELDVLLTDSSTNVGRRGAATSADRR